MQINSKNQISFEKTLVANCQILNKGKQEACRIFELDRKIDFDYFKSLLTDRSWRGQGFVEYIDDIFTHKGSPRERFYAIENIRGKKLGFCQIYDTSLGCDELEIIETMPSAAHECEKRKRKYIGETLMSFLIKKAQLAGKKEFLIPVPIADAKGFYIDKCGFERYGTTSLKMTSNLFDRLLKLNQSHTNGSIDIVG